MLCCVEKCLVFEFPPVRGGRFESVTKSATLELRWRREPEVYAHRKKETGAYGAPHPDECAMRTGK